MAGNNHGSLDRADMRFIRRCMKAPLLSRDREQELALAWRDHHGRRAALGIAMLWSDLTFAVRGLTAVPCRKRCAAWKACRRWCSPPNATS